MGEGNIEEKEGSLPKFCSQCGKRLGGTGARGREREGRGERWARRLKTWGGAASGMFSLLFYVFIFAALFGGGLFGGGKGKPSEKLYGRGDEKIAVVDISGVILEEDPGGGFGIGGGGATTSRGMIRTFEDIKKDKNVRALVLRVNSPGGSVTASEEIFQLVKRFKKETGLPIIVSQGDTAASGGYYVSLAGDEIVADATTLTGSIGAIIQTVNFSGLAGKIGVKGVVIASGENKDLLNPFKEVKGEHVRILKGIVNEARGQFVSRILEARGIKRSKLEPIADGRVLSGKQAMVAGLVDKLGNFNDAVELAKNRAGLKEASVVEFGKKGLLESLLGAVSRRFSLIANTPFDYLHFLSARPAYLYLP